MRRGDFVYSVCRPHFVLSALLAYIARANIIASAIGTVVGNPWTFPFIWWGCSTSATDFARRWDGGRGNRFSRLRSPQA
jgi:hypothetical protein